MSSSFGPGIMELDAQFSEIKINTENCIFELTNYDFKQIVERASTDDFLLKHNPIEIVQLILPQPADKYFKLHHLLTHHFEYFVWR